MHYPCPPSNQKSTSKRTTMIRFFLSSGSCSGARSAALHRRTSRGPFWSVTISYSRSVSHSSVLFEAYSNVLITNVVITYMVSHEMTSYTSVKSKPRLRDKVFQCKYNSLQCIVTKDTIFKVQDLSQVWTQKKH